jgi:hypothetical protein
MSSLVADRARKARKASRLACGCFIRPGHLIARVGDRWVCIEHLLAARETATRSSGEEGTQRPRPHSARH